MSNRLTKGKALVGGMSIDSITGLELATTSQFVTSFVKVIPITSAASTTEQDTGYDLPAYSKLTDVTVLITTASSAGSVLDVGLLASSSGDADGFADGLSTTGTGLKSPTFTTSTSGATGSFAVSNTYGAFLSAFSSGSTAANDPGFAARKIHVSDAVTAKSVTWTSNSTSTSLVGSLILHITQFPS